MRVVCRATTTRGDELPYWIKKTDFYNHFDLEDARFRLPEVINWAYLTEWFTCYDGQPLTFNMPGIHFVNGRTEFFNGRHRTALLFEHLDEMPFSFKVKSKNDEQLLSLIPNRPFESSDTLFVPDLPIWKKMPFNSFVGEEPVMLARWSTVPEIRRKLDPPPDFKSILTVKIVMNGVRLV